MSDRTPKPKLDIKNGLIKAAANVKAVVGDAKDKAVDGAVEARNRLDIKRYEPVFAEEFESRSVILPGVIRVIDGEDKRFQAPVCAEAVAFREHYADKGNHQNLNVLCVHEDYLEKLHARFLSDQRAPLYHVHPFISGGYVSLAEYFPFIQKGRVDELEEIARALGAKHIRITLKEEKKKYIDNEFKGKGKLNKGAKIDVQTNKGLHSEEYETVSIKAETTFEGHNNPRRPDLVYFQNEMDIRNLIEGRISGENPVISKTYELKCNHSLGIKESEAVVIDAMVKKLGMAIHANASYASSVQQENRSILEYQIDF